MYALSDRQIQKRSKGEDEMTLKEKLSIYLHPAVIDGVLTELKQAVLWVIPKKETTRNDYSLGYNQAIDEITRDIERVLEEKGQEE